MDRKTGNTEKKPIKINIKQNYIKTSIIKIEKHQLLYGQIGY